MRFSRGDTVFLTKEFIELNKSWLNTRTAFIDSIEHPGYHCIGQDGERFFCYDDDFREIVKPKRRFIKTPLWYRVANK